MRVGDLRDRVDVRDIAVRVAEGLEEDRPGVIRDGRLDFREVMNVDECCTNTVLREGMRKEVEAAAVDRLLCDDVTAVCGQGFYRVGDGRRARCNRQGCAAAFECRKSLLQDFLGGVGETPVDVAGVGQAEAVRRVLTVSEDIGCGLVDRDRTGVRCGIRLFLSDVQL